ncbi:TPA: formate/nitrite transporter family protein [Clostridium botulinum]|uniref:formate/nitrite transporter family protein n=1 Tax=Clostridium TaxID=1485 RepID=UPI0005F95BD4|nr:MULTISPECIES: formate/nitrite transporter family protein [Clostridium]AUM94826.1 nitrite transporter NirC [Clostridium sporogenes]AVQ52261.1 formate/nitrite transporter family protein [Clostridium botulinum]EKO1914074.1 formate/nitrite transporter family protein [Clostridium botulinum]EKO2044129.1 formate/nitrite transporter family protein [Clostridium botulinum]MBU5299196.1 formate/nitrite transporter family protein [Clostridium sporogenes]
MYSEEINKISNVAENKRDLLRNNKAGYLVSSALAGIYVGIGIILIFTLGGNLASVNSPYVKLIMGLSFGIALSLVIMAGSELFTGNNMVMTIGTLNKKTTWKDTLSIWGFSFVGNLIGSMLLALIFVNAGLAKGAVGKFILKTAEIKMTLPPMELFLRGLLCNILVCLAVWCSLKMKEETGKLIMIFWCLFAFISSGFEHSVANMTLLSIALFIPHGLGVSISGLAYNLIFVSLGNIIGGALFVGAAYYKISKK